MAYHQQTAYQRDKMEGYSLDWANQPEQFKKYRDLDPAELPLPGFEKTPFWDLALGRAGERAREEALTAGALSGVLALAAGVTAVSGQVAFRSWASAGGLFPSELYLVSSGVKGLSDGLRHYAPNGHGLHHLGPACPQIAAQASGLPARRLQFFLSAFFWRSLWKYRNRCFRYCLLDTGHLLANLCLALEAAGWPYRVSLDFADMALAEILGLDTRQEAPLVALSAGPKTQARGGAPLPQEQRPQALPASHLPGRDPLVEQAWRQGVLPEARPPIGAAQESPPADGMALPAPQAGGPDLAEVVAARRSRRNFAGLPADPGELSRFLACGLGDIHPCRASVLLAPGSQPGQGHFEYHPGTHSLSPLGQGEGLRQKSAAACLGQMWVGLAAVQVIFWADLERLREEAGPRAYRRAMLTAGRAGQRLYLAATALGWGACGIGAFFDRELAGVLNLPEGAWPLYLLAAGPLKGGPRRNPLAAE